MQQAKFGPAYAGADPGGVDGVASHTLTVANL